MSILPEDKSGVKIVPTRLLTSRLLGNRSDRTHTNYCKIWDDCSPQVQTVIFSATSAIAAIDRAIMWETKVSQSRQPRDIQGKINNGAIRDLLESMMAQVETDEASSCMERQ